MKTNDFVLWRNTDNQFCRGRILRLRSSDTLSAKVEQYNLINGRWEVGDRVDIPRSELRPCAPLDFSQARSSAMVKKPPPETSTPPKDMAVVEMKSRAMEIRPITQSEADEINSRWIPAGGDAVNSSNTVAVPFVVSDNLVNRGMGRWPVDSLKAQTKYLKGRPFKLDHDWDSVKTNWGRIFHCSMIRADSAPSEVLDMAGLGPLNRKIVEAEGYCQVAVLAYVDANHPVLDQIRKGIYSEVSMGAFAFEDMGCPICNKSFMDKSCPHGIPSQINRSPYLKMYYEEDEIKKFAPYYNRMGCTDVGEVSLVSIPNLPAVGSIR